MVHLKKETYVAIHTLCVCLKSGAYNLAVIVCNELFQF